MINKLIKFESMPWETPHKGVAQKVYIEDTNRLRLLRFNDDFMEEDWCLNGHVGFVVEGEMNVDFNGEMTVYKKGDGLWIPAGENSKHKVIMEKGKEVLLILFESLK